MKSASAQVQAVWFPAILMRGADVDSVLSQVLQDRVSDHFLSLFFSFFSFCGGGGGGGGGYFVGPAFSSFSINSIEYFVPVYWEETEVGARMGGKGGGD